jgi:signal recognition particle receptor subunit beta
MVQFNFAERTIKAKVVYYGPPQSGKTTNLEQIHRLTDPGGMSRLVSLNTGQDRTLFFDLLPFSLGNVAGYDFKLQVYTVPGQVQYNATRRVVLSGADAVVFVADSQRGMLKENLASLENMKVNLLANRLVPEKVPLVLQYNKRDLGEVLSLEELDTGLNAWGRPTFPAVAATGDGVMDAFIAAVQQMLTSIAVKYNLREKGLDPTAVPDIVSDAFTNVLREAERVSASMASGAPSAPPPAPPRLVVSEPGDRAAPEGPVVPEDLLHRALHSNVTLAESLSGLVREMNLGLAAILSHAELVLLYREGAREKREAAAHSIQQEAQRLRGVVEQLSRSALPPPEPLAAAEPPKAKPAAGDSPAAPPRPARGGPSATLPPARPRPAPPSATAVPATFDGLLRAVVDRALGAQGGALAIELKVAPGLASPSCPADELERMLSALLSGVAAAAPPRSAFTVQAERKPVVLKSREGEQKRDFLLLAVRQSGGPSADEQTRIAAGDPGLYGGSARRLRELGGFIRFSPSAGGLEMRVFLPTA